MLLEGMATGGDFYKVFVANEPDFALAMAEHDPELGKRLRAGGEVTEWHSLGLVLEEGIVVDYLPNSFAFRMCSRRLRDVLERLRGESDVIQWLPVTVTDGRGEDIPYSILHFPQVPDVINKSRSVFSGPRLVKPCLDSERVDGHRVFSFPHDSVSLVIADTVRNAIVEAGCGGMTFSKFPIA